MRCAIWYHLSNLKNVKITHGRVLILVKLQAKACNFTKSNTPPWVFFTFFKLYKLYQTAQRITYLEFCFAHSLQQIITMSIRVTDQTATLIDHILTNSPEVSQSEVIDLSLYSLGLQLY